MLQVLMPPNDKFNHTLAAVSRPIDSCDAEDTAVYLDVERSIIWAYDWTSRWDEAKLNLDKYRSGIKAGVRLFANTNSTNVTTSDAQTASVIVAMPAYTVPMAASSVACVNLALPNATAFHVTQYQGFNTTPLVVRVAGFVCAAGVIPPQPLGIPYDCSAATQLMPALPGSLPVGCETLNFVWVPGAGRFTTPPEAGFSIGAGAATTLVLQVVYWNLAGAVGQVRGGGQSTGTRAQSTRALGWVLEEAA